EDGVDLRRSHEAMRSLERGPRMRRGIIPCGRQTMSAMAAAPNATIRHSSVERKNSGRVVQIAAPRIGPRHEVAPPMITMRRKARLGANPPLAGVMIVVLPA